MAHQTPDASQRQRGLLKERHRRSLRARELRRALAAITPETSLPQTQSRLFSVLPGEIRFHIFTFALSQHCDCSRQAHIDTDSRPGHTHDSTVDTPLLHTCRLIYYEARAIPLRSATHHIQTTWSSDVTDNCLFHITKHRGADLYHLHDTLSTHLLSADSFTKYLLRHLRWRRVTWTVRTLNGFLPDEKEHLTLLPGLLTALLLPHGCKEVNLELEIRQTRLHDLSTLLEHARACQNVSIKRRENTSLEFDDGYSLRYKWQAGHYIDPGEKAYHTFHTIRLCWRARIATREYMSYDHLDCLNLKNCPEVQEIMAFK